jgi:hypothetical protein
MKKKKKKMPFMMPNGEIILPKKLNKKSKKILQALMSGNIKLRNEKKYFMIVFDNNHQYLIESNKLENAIKEAKKELLSGYGKMWKLLEIRSSGSIFEGKVSGKKVRVIKGEPLFVL